MIMSLSFLGVAACGTNIPYKCTSRNIANSDLQRRVVYIDDRLQIARQKGTPVTMTDQERINQLRSVNAVSTYLDQ